MSEPCFKFILNTFRPDQQLSEVERRDLKQLLLEVERDFGVCVRARKNTIQVFRMAADRLDQFTKVWEGLVIGGGVIIVIGNISSELFGQLGAFLAHYYPVEGLDLALASATHSTKH